MKNPLFLSALLAPVLAQGAGFQLQERSASGLGRAFAGEGVIAEDASVLASNPATMLLLPGDTSVAAGLSGIFTGIDVRGTYTPPGGTPLPAVADDISSDAAIPYLYLTRRVNERLSLGFGSYTTFGLNTNYPLTFSARGVADHSSIRSVNLNPAAALRLTDWLSVGAGFDALYADGVINATLPNSLPTLDLAGDDWGYGFNAGLLLELGEATRIGLHYRSRIDLTLEGRAVSVVGAFNGPATLDVTLPDSLTLSGYHEFSERWAIHGNVTWVGWSSFDQLAPQIVGAPVQPPASAENWDDSLRLALGTTWRACDTVTLRAGLAWDESPVDPAFMTLRIPDADRLWLSLGMSYHFNPCWSLDLGYTHVFAETARITDGSPATGVFAGTAGGDADVVSLGFSGNF